MTIPQAVLTQIQTNPEQSPKPDFFPEPDPESPRPDAESMPEEPDPETPGADPGQKSPGLPPELDPDLAMVR